MFPTSARAHGTCALLLAAACAGAEPPPSSDGVLLELPDALARTLERHPELVVYDFDVQGAEGLLRQAELRPNPELEVELEDMLGTGAVRGVRGAEATVTLGWLLERGVRERLIEAAGVGVAVARTEAEAARLDAAAETARRFIACLAHQAHVARAREAVALAIETEAAVRRRVDAALAPEAELARALAERARAELAAEGEEHELAIAYRRLSAQWGDAEPDFTAVAGSLTPPVVDDYAALEARLDASPELLRLATRRRLDEAELKLEEARRRRAWRLEAGVRRLEVSDDWALVAGVAMPLAFRDRNQGAIAAARAELAHTDAETAAARSRLRTTLFVLHQELTHQVHVGESLRDDVIPRLEQALAATGDAYERGRYGYLELRAAQGDLLAARAELVEANASAQLARIEIERLTGMALPAGRSSGERR